MKYFCNKTSGYTPLLSSPSTTAPKVNGINLNPNTVVSHVADAGAFVQVEYVNAKGQYVGYIERRLLDVYIESLPRDCVDLEGLQTSDPSDAAQYIMWTPYKGGGSYRQVNMCGQICCSYLAHSSLENVLTAWEMCNPSSYNRIFGSDGIADGTAPSDLVTILKCIGIPAAEISSKDFPQYTPELVSKWNGVIVSCHIDTTRNGRLSGDGVLHWIIIVNSFLDRCGYGTVDIFNPFSNRVERYSYSEFAKSCRTPYGVIPA